MLIGFHASHEQWSPRRLLEQVQWAEVAGFAAAMCSDHFHPWSEDQGESGFAWSWLGSALATTSLSFGTVCAPGQRYHPAIIAQAAATLAEMFPGRFWLSVGSGEALNEHLTGDPWPPKEVRNQRLRECVDVMRRLWAGETVSHQGTIVVDRAKLYTRPVRPPAVIGAALSATTAAWMGSWADGLITAGSNVDSLRQVTDAFRENGGAGKPIYLQTAISMERTLEDSQAVARKVWRQAALSPSDLSDLETPGQFDAHTAGVTAEQVSKRLRVSPHVSQHLEWLLQDRELGFETVYIHFLGPNVRESLTAFGTNVLPHFR